MRKIRSILCFCAIIFAWKFVSTVVGEGEENSSKKAISEDVLDDALPEDEEFEEFTDEPKDGADEDDVGDEEDDDSEAGVDGSEAGVDGSEAGVDGVPYGDDDGGDDVDIHHEEDDISPEYDETSIDSEHDNMEDDENDRDTAYANELENNESLKDSSELTLKSENGQGTVKESKNPMEKDVNEVDKVNDIFTSVGQEVVFVFQ